MHKSDSSVKFSDILAKLDPDRAPSKKQAAVIDSKEKHLLVVAGAGSGKTTTIVNRILSQRYNGASAQSILGLTFTVKASLELASRAENLAEDVVTKAEKSNFFDIANRAKKTLGSDCGSIRVQTYDSFIQEIVRQNGILIGVDPQTTLLEKDAGVYQCISQVCDDEIEKIRHVYGAIAEECPDFTLPALTPSGDRDSLPKAVKQFSGQIINFLIDKDCLEVKSALQKLKAYNDTWLNTLKSMKRGMSEPDNPAKKNLDSLICNAMLRDLVIDLSEKYEDIKEKNNLAEYGDFTRYALQLAYYSPGIAEFYRSRYKYVFLDEYQDTNYAQGLLLWKLFGDGGTSVTAVGDSQQAIFGFRGTTPGAFEYFKTNFGCSSEDGSELYLDVTFRNKNNVTQLANCITKLHPDEHDEHRSFESNSDDNAEICAVAYSGKDGKDFGPASVFEFAKAEDYENHNLAILGRRNEDLPPYRDFLEKNQIPCVLTGEMKFNDENPIAKDLRNFLSACSDPFAVQQTEDILTSPRYSLPLKGMLILAERVKELNDVLKSNFLPSDAAEGVNENHRDYDNDPILITLPAYLMHRATSEEYKLGPSQLRKTAQRIERNSKGRLSLNEGDDFYRDVSEILERFRKNLQQVESAIPQGVEAAVASAWKALDFSVDVGIAEKFYEGRLPYENLTLSDALEAARTYESNLFGTQAPTLQGFLNWITNYTKDYQEDLAGKKGVIELMTIHKAKGLEWDAVAVVGMEDLPHKHKETFEKNGFQARKGMYWKLTWLNKYNVIPGNKRSDLRYCSTSYQEACNLFNDLSSLNLNELSIYIDKLCEAEIGRDKLEEAHNAYVAMTRTKGDLLLISKSNLSKVSDPKESGIFWVDAAKFILLDGECCGDASKCDETLWSAGKDVNGKFAIYSTSTGCKTIKQAIEKVLIGLENEAESSETYLWPLQIRREFRDTLRKSKECVESISRRELEEELGKKKGDKNLGLLNKAQQLLNIPKSQEHKSLEKRFLEANGNKAVSGTALQEFLADPEKALNFVLRPMPHGPNKAAEEGTKFHAWVAQQLDPNKAKQGKIEIENEDWKDAFLNSPWPNRRVFSVEEQRSIQIEGIGPITVRMDAVFKGDREGRDTEFKLTIVDWKTGRLPSSDDQREKLRQLDIYRLVLSRALPKDIEDIDACLFYVSAEKGKESPYVYANIEDSETDILKDLLTPEGLCAWSNDEQKAE